MQCLPYFILSLVAGCLFSNSSAQIKTDTLQEVEVRSGTSTVSNTKAEFQPGAKVVGFDSSLLQQYRHQNVATLLSQVSSVFIKSYGFNSLATLSFRGASAAQSSVLWEGIPLMNAATGVADVSLIPVAFSDSISIQYGSSGALGGSGNVGGALLLQSQQARFSQNPRWKAAAQIGWGSFNQAPATVELGFSSGRLSLRMRGFRVDADNDFTAIDESGNSFTTEHAALHGAGILVDASFKVNPRNVVSLHAWQQSYSRQIPRALFEASSAKVQDDGSLRLLAEWQRSGRNRQMYLKAAFLQDRFQYSDPAIQLQSRAVTDHCYAEWGLQGSLGPSVSWLLFTPVQYLQLKGDAGRPHQFRSALAGNLKKSFLEKRLVVGANARAELFDSKLIGLPGLSASYQLAPAWRAQLSAQRSYRMPTLNELYYVPGGNEDLKPERGWSTEIGYTYAKRLNSNVFVTHGLAAYNRNIKDWIIWLGGAIWTPHNLAAVHSRGLETENELVVRSGAVQWRLSFSAAYTRSTPTESYLQNDNSIGRQIPYTPRFTGSVLAAASWHGATLTYVQSYAGKRFVTSDESASLAHYGTGNIILGYMARKSAPCLIFNASIQNIWNNRYSVVAYRPMPGINYLISMAVSLN